MKRQHRIAGILSTLLIAGLFLPQAVVAQQNPSQPAQQPETSQQPQQNQSTATQPAQPSAAPSTTAPTTAGDQSQQSQQQQTPSQSGTSINPSQAPLQPVQPVTTYPDASGANQEQPGTTTVPTQSTTAPEAPQPKKQPAEPVGAAAAESVPTAGGAAAKPAGVAIAPAKQHQTRSLLIKIGAVAAAGAALGAVFALSHSTPSTPPGTAMPGVTPK